MNKYVKFGLAVILCVFQFSLAYAYYERTLQIITILISIPFVGYVANKFRFEAAIIILLVANALAALL